MKTVQITVEIEDWPEDIEEQAENLNALEHVDVPFGEVVEARAQELN